jgi:hypothetical protein
MTACCDSDLLLDLAVRLPDAPAAMDHLATCPRCRARLEEWSTLRANLLPAADPPPGDEARVMAAFRATRRDEALEGRGGGAWSAVVVFGAASVLAYTVLASVGDVPHAAAAWVEPILAAAAGLAAAAWCTAGVRGQMGIADPSARAGPGQSTWL